METRRFGYIATNVTFFVLADEPHRGQMKATPTEKEDVSGDQSQAGRRQRFVLLECDYRSVYSVYFWK